MESKKDIEIDETNPVILGFPEVPKPKDFLPENFPSKIGGLPTWLVPLEGKISINFFKCSCGKSLSFLLQLYCPLEDNDNAFHRVLYVFFCSDCWINKNVVKVLRIQLKENSSIYKGETMLNKNILQDDKTIIEVNKLLSSSPVVLKEYTISTSNENKEASKKYFQFYNEIDEKSFTSTSSVGGKKFNLNQIDEDDIVEISKDESNQYGQLLKNYLAENPNADINKIEIEEVDELESDQQLNENEDLFFQVFSSVVDYDKKQVVRYYRNDYFPLWFTKDEMLTVQNTKCKNCKGEIEYEFQIMPYLFTVEPAIAYMDIGTIVIYTCKNSCCNKSKNIEGEFIEEYGFIQRTGEDFIDIKGNKMHKKKKNNSNKNQQELNNQNKKIEEVDEDGFVEVKKKRKK